MANYHLVIADAQLAHDREIHRNVEANVKVHGEASRSQITKILQKRFDQGPRPVGTIHDTVDTDCPAGLPNCRNCGDPAFAASCAAAGHCPHCGTQHGCAPDAVVKAHGYRLEPV